MLALLTAAFLPTPGKGDKLLRSWEIRVDLCHNWRSETGPQREPLLTFVCDAVQAGKITIWRPPDGLRRQFHDAPYIACAALQFKAAEVDVCAIRVAANINSNGPGKDPEVVRQ